MSQRENKFLTAHQLAARWNGAFTTGTLANWRYKKVGPAFVKARGRILYPTDQVEAWEAKNMHANDNGVQAVAAA